MSVNILRRLVKFASSSLLIARPAKNFFATNSAQDLASAKPTQAQISGLPHRRFLTDNPVAYNQAVTAAESYVSKLEGGVVSWLHCKPFDATAGNPQYFRLMFDLLNILQAMQIPPGGRILEVGSGPGWVTEILLMLGFSVDALEPSGDLIAIARERCTALSTHYRHKANPPVTFHRATLEDTEFDEERFDAILFFDVLHHVVHEEVALEKCFAYLKPDGCLGIVEGAWHPDFKALEQSLIDEMAQFGTLENPFSTEYLDLLLTRFGFVEVQRHAAVNGFFSQSQLTQPLGNFAVQTLASSNNVTARKPSLTGVRYPPCTVIDRKTDVILRLLSGGIDAEKKVAIVQIRLKNSGETLLSHRTQQIGHITLALRHGKPDSPMFLECRERHALPESLIPGDEIVLKLAFTLPVTAPSLENWELDLVAESCYWFSSRGIKTCHVPLLTKP
jgi:SAM-dependent methyltransferase